MPSAPTARDAQKRFDHNANRRPSFARALRRILDEANIEDAPIERMELNCLNSGELTFRYWPVGAEEAEGGVLAEPETH